jgi:uroporphyrinogen decarboxylase
MGDAIMSLGLQPSIGEASASCSLISPKIYREFIQPYHKELKEYFLKKKGFLSVHICGYIDPIAKDVIDVGMSPLSIDGPTSLEKCVHLSGGRITIMGNIPTVLFATGSREEMENAIRYCIDTAASGSHYILSSGCEIPRNSTLDRIEHYLEYGRRYGREFISRLREERPELFQS